MCSLYVAYCNFVAIILALLQTLPIPELGSNLSLITASNTTSTTYVNTQKQKHRIVYLYAVTKCTYTHMLTCMLYTCMYNTYVHIMLTQFASVLSKLLCLHRLGQPPEKGESVMFKLK